jgi:hypothetical protein
MQSSYNFIHMFCSIQIHRHTDTSCHEIIIKYVTYHHHAMHTHHLFSSHSGVEGYTAQRSFISWFLGVLNPRVFRLMVSRGTQPKGLSFHSAKGYAAQWSYCMVLKGTKPNGL